MEKEINANHAITARVRVGNAEFVMGEHPTAPSQFVTWERNCKNDGDGPHNYFWGHYGTTRDGMIEDFLQRVRAEYDFQHQLSAPTKQVEENMDDKSAVTPVGRIDFLGANGQVGESIEYTDAKAFEKEIRECNDCGVPMKVIVYRDADGNTVPHKFVGVCDPPLHGFKIEPAPTEKNADIFRAAGEMCKNMPMPECDEPEL